ncbi:MAG: hypothetical protein LBP65_04060 [Puniceicoccales bacterium]|nr:hypothetical protein [Puniceicoccales bacterium]
MTDHPVDNEGQCSPFDANLQKLKETGAAVHEIACLDDIVSGHGQGGAAVIAATEDGGMVLPISITGAGDDVDEALAKSLDRTRPLDEFVQNKAAREVQIYIPSSPFSDAIGSIHAGAKTASIPSAALGDLTRQQAEHLVTEGQKLLATIKDRSENELINSSPLRSTADVAAVIWALNVEAWKIDSNFQQLSSAMTIPEDRVYLALQNAQTNDGKKLCYGRGGAGQSTHLKPFPTSKGTQLGMDIKDVPLPYGKTTLLVGNLRKEETGFSENRTFLKLESYGTKSFIDKLGHLLSLIRTAFHSVTRNMDFREKTTKISRHVADFCKRNPPPAAIDRKQLQIAAQKGLCNLARHRAMLATEVATPEADREIGQWLTAFASSTDKFLEKKILKDGECGAIEKWKAADPGRSTLAYFCDRPQIGSEISLPCYPCSRPQTGEESSPLPNLPNR